MTKRGMRLEKDFPIIKPATSEWDILQLLEGLNAREVRLSAASSGFEGDTDVLLAAPLPSPASPQKNEALGLFYVGESSRRYGFNVDYWDARHENENIFWEKLSRANTVGFTAITGYQLLEFINLAEKIKKFRPKIPIILGGAHATLTKPKINLADSLIDFVVMGEGELRLPALLRALYLGEGMKLVDGIGYKTKDGATIIQPSKHVPDPNRGHLVRAVSDQTMPYFKVAAVRNEMILPASRGCPWSTDSCDFCSVGKQYSDSYRAFPFDLWRADVEAVRQEVPVRHIELEDENSAIAILPNKGYLPFLKSMEISSHLHLRSDQLLDSERVRWLADMGVVRIHIGVESGSERVLDRIMHKNLNVENHFIAARNLSAVGIEMVGTYVVANPTETWGEICQTLKLAEDLSRAFPKKRYRATVYVLAALPGTPIFYTIERMHEFHKLLLMLGNKFGGRKSLFPPNYLNELRAWSRSVSGVKRLCRAETKHPKVADTVEEALNRFLETGEGFKDILVETEKWLWPTPKTLRGWANVSAAYNPFLPKHYNAIYPIAGMHHNKYHKSPQNFPGWKKILIKPFELACDLRCRFYFFKYAGLELWLLEKLLKWASKRSVGKNLEETHRRKVMENYSEAQAGH